MSDIPYKQEMNPKTKAIAIIIVLMIIGMAVGLIIVRGSINYAKTKTKDVNQRVVNLFWTVYTISTIIICINILFLIGLFCIYVQTFRKTKSSFMFGLIIFIGVLFVQSFLSLPIFPASMGESLTLFGILPNMFETIALVILLYLSME